MAFLHIIFVGFLSLAGFGSHVTGHLSPDPAMFSLNDHHHLSDVYVDLPVKSYISQLRFKKRKYKAKGTESTFSFIALELSTDFNFKTFTVLSEKELVVLSLRGKIRERAPPLIGLQFV